MSDPLFNVILEGTIGEDRSRAEVVETLVGVFKKDRAAVEKLLDGTRRRIRQRIDLQTAEKYRRIIEKAGAVCTVEPESLPEPEAASPADDPVAAGYAVAAFEPCPRCGYVPANEDDVMIVRGDCPKCGLMVKGRSLGEASGADEAPADDEAGPEPEEEPAAALIAAASLSRRALASMYTFGCFAAVYCGIVLLFVLLFIPLTSVPRYLAREFVVATYTVAPALMAGLSILVVSFLVPIFKQGRTWGQQAFTIELLYTPEAQSGGLVLSLAFRTMAVLLLTLAPGLSVVWSLPEKVLALGPWVEPAVIAAIAVIAWSASWLVCLMSSSRRSLLDHAGGTVQTEVGVMPPHALRKAFGLLFLVLIGLCLLGALSHVYPMLER